MRTQVLSVALALAAVVTAAQGDVGRIAPFGAGLVAMAPATTVQTSEQVLWIALAPVSAPARTEYAGDHANGFGIARDGGATGATTRYARHASRAWLGAPDGGLSITGAAIAPVLEFGDHDGGDLHLVQVASEDAPLPVHGLSLPQSFTGTLPCADCEGIRHHLDLWPDQGFHLRREWLKGAASATEDAIGRWSLDGRTGALVLHGANAGMWDIRGPDTLRLLDRTGAPIVSDLPYELSGDGTLGPTDIALPMEGAFVYFADAALFETCVTGRRFPVAMEAGYLEAERAYLGAGLDPGSPVMMVVDGTLAMRDAMEGPARQHLVIDRMIAAQPGRSCTRARAAADLRDTYWRLVQLGGTPVVGIGGATEPHMVLRGGMAPGLAATMGCNRMMAGFDASDASIGFQTVASTMMACPDPIALLERDFAAMLEAVDGWQVVGQTLILSAGGDPVAVFEAVYLP